MRILLILIWSLKSFVVLGQAYATYTYTTKDGLPINELLDLAMDTSGCIWLQSGLGITRFDGKKFTHFDNSSILRRGGNISCLFGDYEGNIWVLIHNPTPPKTQAIIFHGINKKDIVTIDSLEQASLGIHPYTGKIYSFGHTNTLKFYNSKSGKVATSCEIKTPEFLLGENTEVDVVPMYFSPGWTVVVKKDNNTIWSYYNWEDGKYTKIPFNKKIEVYYPWSYPAKLPDGSYFVRNGTQCYRVSAKGRMFPFHISWDAKKTPLNSQLLAQELSFQAALHNGSSYGSIIEFSNALPQGYAFKFHTPTPIYKWGSVVKGKDGTYWPLPGTAFYIFSLICMKYCLAMGNQCPATYMLRARINPEMYGLDRTPTVSNTSMDYQSVIL